MKEDPDYEVGYGKPPKHSQFQKGESGNPHGRPKKKKSVQEIFDDEWEIQMNANGQKMSKIQLFVRQLVNDGIKGKASARNLLMGRLPDTKDELEDFDPSLDDRIEAVKATRRVERRLREENDEQAS